MRILICDDDEAIRKELTNYIQNYFKQCSTKCPEISCFSNGESLLSDTGEKDILFLDIEMPGMNGIYIGNELKKQNNNIINIVVTAYNEYLDDAMRFNVFRYLSKPIEKKRLFRNLNDALKFYHSSKVKIPIETKKGIFTVFSSDIISVEAINRKVIVHTIQRDYESIHTINYLISILPKNCFFQTHRSYIINFNHICSFNHSTIDLFDYKFRAYLTKRKYTKFKEAYLFYITNYMM